MASTTIDTETELSAVNSILGAIGQSPVTTLVFDNPEISFIYNLLRDANVDVQNEGWHFNTEKHVTYKPDSVTGKIAIGSDILRMDVTDGWSKRQFDVVRRGGNLYDKYDHTDEFTEDLSLDVVWLQKFEDIPQVFKRYVIYCASSRAAAQLVANPQLVQMLQQKEGYARAACLEYECNQTDPSFFGLGHDQRYTSFIPLDALRR